MKFKFILIFFITIRAFSQDTLTIHRFDFEKHFYGDLKHIEYWYKIFVEIDSDSISIDKQPIVDYIKLRLKNDISTIPIKISDKSGSWHFLFDDSITGNELKAGRISMDIWCVGNDYPTVFHIKFCVGNCDDYNIYENSVLGCCSRNHLMNKIKESIDEFIEDFAIIFYKIRDEL